MKALSWQSIMPKPITNCMKCHYAAKRYSKSGEDFVCIIGEDDEDKLRLFSENKDGLTPTCPMLQREKVFLDVDRGVRINRDLLQN